VPVDDLQKYSTRVFSAESFNFSVLTDDQALRDAVECLFSDLESGEEPAAEFSFARTSNGFRGQGTDTWSDEGERDGDTILNELVTAVNRRRLDHGSGRLHLHAGLVARHGTAVLIAGASGEGKTTLVTTLALGGWTYLTDEAVSIALGDSVARAFPKPITLKQPGTDFFPELADERVSLDHSPTTLWNVPLGRVGVTTATAAEPTLVVLLSRGTSEIPSWEPVRPADAVVGLVEQSLDLERYGDDALHALAELCARRNCVQVASGTPGATAQLIETLAAEDTTLDLAIARLDTSSHHSIVNPHVVALSLGDDAVLRHDATGQVVSLNSAAAEVWRIVASPGFEPELLRPEQAQFVRQLADLDFVNLPSDSVTTDVH
jgi:hypothetical protein